MANLLLAYEYAKESGPKRCVQHRPALTTTRKDRAMAERQLPPPELLRKLLSYDPESGTLTWSHRPQSMFTTKSSWGTWNARYAGKPALSSTHSNGYFYGSILGRHHKAHRVAWAVHYGVWPQGEIDHINHDRADNRLCNLREVSHQQNSCNTSLRADNNSGVAGVFWYRSTGRWVAKIRVNGRNKHLGYFTSFPAAVSARKAAERRFGFHPNHGSN